MTLLFQLVEGLLQCCLLSTYVWSPLKWLWYFLIHVMLMLSLLKGWWIFCFHLCITMLLAKFNATLLLKSFLYFTANENLTNTGYTHSLVDYQWLTVCGWGNIHACLTIKQNPEVMLEWKSYDQPRPNSNKSFYAMMKWPGYILVHISIDVKF